MILSITASGSMHYSTKIEWWGHWGVIKLSK